MLPAARAGQAEGAVTLPRAVLLVSALLLGWIVLPQGVKLKSDEPAIMPATDLFSGKPAPSVLKISTAAPRNPGVWLMP